MTNEERFVASCVSEGEIGVRQKLNAGRYSERRTIWAGNWLADVENGKSDATRAEEKTNLTRMTARPRWPIIRVASALLLIALATCAIVFLRYG